MVCCQLNRTTQPIQYVCAAVFGECNSSILFFYLNLSKEYKNKKKKKHFIDATLGPCPNMVMFPFKKQNISIKTLSPERILLIIVQILTFFSAILQ